MAKGGKVAKGGGKDERRAKKANANRNREHRREERRALDRSELVQFAVLLKGNSLLLREVERDGNCFFRSLADQIEDCEHNHAEYRATVMDYVESHKEDFEPFFSFGEGEDEEDADFSEYITRMRLDGEWAGNYEIIAAVSLSRLSLSPPTRLPATRRPAAASTACAPLPAANRRVRSTCTSWCTSLRCPPTARSQASPTHRSYTCPTTTAPAATRTLGPR
jgi:hypothetical protein